MDHQGRYIIHLRNYYWRVWNQSPHQEFLTLPDFLYLLGLPETQQIQNYHGGHDDTQSLGST